MSIFEYAKWSAYHEASINNIRDNSLKYYWLLLICVMVEVKWVINTKICEWQGHELVDEGYAGPDSGCIDIVCRRCGWNYRKTLY